MFMFVSGNETEVIETEAVEFRRRLGWRGLSLGGRAKEGGGVLDCVGRESNACSCGQSVAR